MTPPRRWVRTTSPGFGASVPGSVGPWHLPADEREGCALARCHELLVVGEATEARPPGRVCSGCIAQLVLDVVYGAAT